MLDFITSLTSTHLFLVIAGILSTIISFLWKSNKDLRDKNTLAESKNQELVQNIVTIKDEAISTINDLKKQDEIDANTLIDNDSVLEWMHTAKQPNFNNTQPDRPNSTSVPLPNSTSDI